MILMADNHNFQHELALEALLLRKAAQGPSLPGIPLNPFALEKGDTWISWL